MELEGVLRTEMIRYNNLLATIRSSTQRLLHAQKGLTPLTHACEVLRKEIISGIIPTEWTKHSHTSEKGLGEYLRDLKERVDFVQQWAEKGTPRIMKMGALFSPKSLIMGLLQR